MGERRGVGPGCDDLHLPTIPQRGSAAISQWVWDPPSNCPPPRIDGETEALRGEGLAEVLALRSLPFAQQHPSPHQLPQSLHPLPRIFNAIGLDEVIVFV